MITKFKCPHCGNSEVSKAKEYDGILGYEAIICMVCRWIHDHLGSHPPEK